MSEKWTKGKCTRCRRTLREHEDMHLLACAHFISPEVAELQEQNKALAEALRELRDAVVNEDKLATVKALFKAEAALRGALGEL